MIESICLNKKFSTTRLISKVKPLIGSRQNDKFETLIILPEN